MGLGLGSQDYRHGALSRLKDAQILRGQQRWAGSIYLAGRAVEGLLRSLLWAKTRQQEIGHDLRQLLRKAQSLGLFNLADDDCIQDSLNEIAVIWHNDLRFVGEDWLSRRLKRLGRFTKVGEMRVKGDPLKANTKNVCDACEAIISRGDVLWVRLNKSSRN